MPGVGTCSHGRSARRTARTPKKVVTTASILCSAKRENGLSTICHTRSDLFGQSKATTQTSNATRKVRPGSVVGRRKEKYIPGFYVRWKNACLEQESARRAARNPV